MKPLFCLLIFLFSVLHGLAQDYSSAVPLTVENASQLELLSRLGRGEVGNIVWSPLGDIFALPTNEGVLIYSSSDFANPIATLPMDGATVFSPDGRFLASESGDIWDFTENRLRGEFIEHPPYLSEFYGPQITFDPSSHYIFATFGTDILVWNVYGVGPQDSFRGDFGEVKISPNGQYLIGREFLSVEESAFYVWSLPERELLHQFTVEGRYKTSTILTDNQTIVSVEANSIKWFNLETGEAIFSHLSILDRPDEVVLSVSGNSLYVLGVKGAGIAITEILLDESNLPGEESIIYEQLGVPNWGLGPDLGTMNLSPDGTYLSLLSAFQGFALINLETKQREYHFLEYMEYVRSARMSADNRYLAVGNGRANLHIWNLETGEVEAALWGDVENTEGVIFDEENLYLLEMDYDGEALGLWDIRKKQLLSQLEISPHISSTLHLASRVMWQPP